MFSLNLLLNQLVNYATIKNFGLGDPDYTASVPTEVQIFGRQLLDVQKILSCIAHKIDDISSWI